MNTTPELNMATDDNIEVKREIIRQSLADIAIEVSNGLRDADISYPVYLVVPGSGNAIVSMVTPASPGDLDWRKTGDIIRGILSKRLDGIELRGVEMPCTMVNATMGATEIIVD